MNTYNVREFATKIGVSVITLQRWDRQGKLKPLRTPGNRRLYTDEHLQQVLAERGIQPPLVRKTIVYLRVSSQAQKPGMDAQRAVLEQFCAARGLTVDDWVTEIGSGLNFKRPKFLKLVDAIIAGEVATLIIAHTDRLARFGYDLIAHLCQEHRCEILILNQETLSPEQEMIQDLMTILQDFSSRIPGLRAYRKTLKEALAYHETNTQDAHDPGV